jgi:hypothetical protein
MKITSKLQGGIGNQLFQISIAYAYSKELNCDYVFLLNEFAGCRQGNHPSLYYNNVFSKIKFDNEIKEDDRVTINENGYGYNDLKNVIPKNRGLVILNGYFQSEKYFEKYRKEIKELFTPTEGMINFLKNNSNIFERFPDILNENNCFIGVRRGDYITYSDFHLPCGMNYYNKAMNKINSNKYYILSDDFDWCKKNLVGDQYIFLDNIDKDYIQLYLISLFKNYIISNSTFYWWGSYLSIHENKNIMAPDKWIKCDNHESIYRNDMTIIQRIVETI